MADIGNGATLTLGTTGLTLDLTSIAWSGISREQVDLSHLGTTGGKPFTPSNQYDPGELQIEGLLDPNDLDSVPLEGAQETITVTFPIPSGGAAGAKMAANGSISELEVNVANEEEMTFSMTFKMSGDITFTDST